MVGCSEENIMKLALWLTVRGKFYRKKQTKRKHSCKQHNLSEIDQKTSCRVDDLIKRTFLLI